MKRGLSQRRVAVLGAVGLLVYVCWMGWPYLEAIIVRDAAVTGWISIVPSPISGYTTDPLYPGSRTGTDGRIATITDRNADTRDLAQKRADATGAAGRAAAQAALVDGMRRNVSWRARHADEFAATFKGDLEAAIASANASLETVRTRLHLARVEAERVARLHEAGLAPQSSVDLADAAVAVLERESAATEAELIRATKRSRAANAGVFLLEDGSDGNAIVLNLADARVRLVQAETTLVQLRAEEKSAQDVLRAAELSYAKSRSLDIIVNPGAMVWNLYSGPGAPVQPGTPVASWIDCGTLLVDVPLSDVATSLLRIGYDADVVLEGERGVRKGHVILTRGSAGVLGSHDLAALAKGRRPGLGQAIVRLEPQPGDFESCPIGHAAHVDFPDVGFFQVLRARLRL